MVGIIVAMKEELDAIKGKMEIIEIKRIYELEIIIGNIQNKPCIITKCGVGKVNSARTTQILIDNFQIEYIINIGSAGSLKENLKIGDIIIGKELIQHDFDITAFGHEKGYITDIGKTFYSDEKLIQKTKKVIPIILNQVEAKVGLIASGDIFCTSEAMKEKIKTKFNADCVEMEGAAIAQVCNLDNIPFLCIRAISDSPNEKNEIDFEKFLSKAANNCADFVEILLK